jgi:hypothetical protein
MANFLRNGLKITTLFSLLLATGLRAQVRPLRDHDEREKVYQRRSQEPPQNQTADQSRNKARVFQDSAKRAEAIAEAYQAIADAERRKARQVTREADRSEDRRKEWDRLSIKGETIYRAVAERCLEVAPYGNSLIEACVAHYVVRDIGYGACLQYQGLSPIHEYRGRHCYSELKHAVTKCLAKQYRPYDIVSCVRRSGHFPYFEIDPQLANETPEQAPFRR